MKLLPFAGAAILLAASIQAGEAQNRKSPPPSPYKYCLDENTGGPGGGSLPLLCRFVTLQQCEASRNSPADRCVPNITGQRS